MKTNKDEKGWVTVDKDGNHKPEKLNENQSFVENGQIYTPYAVSKTYRIPLWLKACFSKWWFAGAVFYFVFFGFGGVVAGEILVIILGLVLGLATDFALNHFFRDLSAPNHDYTKYIFCGKHRKYVTLPINLLYYVVLSYIACIAIFGINYFVEKQFGWSADVFMFTVGALLYAFLMLGIDLIFVFIRNCIDNLIEKRKMAKEEQTTPNSVEEENEKEKEINN